MDQIAIAILNWNGRHWLEKFLPNVVSCSMPHRVYVIDNASTDSSLDYLNKEFPQVGIVKLDKNYGFAKGYNLGLKQINAEYFVLLNSDVEVTPNWIQPVIEQFELFPEAAAIQPKLLDYNNKEYFEYAGAAGGMIDAYGIPFCRGRVFEYLEKDEKQFDKPSKIFWASGAAFFVKSKVFWAVDGFDADFFAHMEEIDLCWRIQNQGYSVMYCPNSKVYHVGGGTLNKINPHKFFLNFRNSLWMLLKNLPTNKLISTIFIRLCFDGVAAIKLAISGKPVMLWVVLKAHFIFYKTLLKTYQKRKTVENLPNEMYKKSLIKAVFINKLKTYQQIIEKS